MLIKYFEYLTRQNINLIIINHIEYGRKQHYRLIEKFKIGTNITTKFYQIPYTY